ncbi:MAG: hypothetical protein DRI79_01570 [Chloroflexi bacterium]|nr:MAG: hypothetical protein DRI80_04710 [Chloroflexota bacterium]RLC92057.1 MAG: hypothetical protein DRI79_01570 [Chloroflexota bacterium]HEY66706.1 sugar phosphate isomerase/epimerase [Thermoflexia bacterium]
MAIKGIGINAHASRLDGSLEILEHDLAHFQRIGFDYVEIPVHGVDAILNGRLNLRQMKRIKEVLARFPRLKYTVHCSNWLNLMEAEEFPLHRSIFEASIDFAGEIEAEILVYHSGKVELGDEYLGQAAFTRELLSIPDRAFVEERERVERETLAELAEIAERKGVTICVENADPRVDEEAVWELARRVRVNGVDLFYRIAPGGDIAVYNYGGVLEHLVRQIEVVGRDNVGITLDVGHAYIASIYYGFDFLDAISLAKPFVKHIHAHDNFGKPAGLDRRQIILVAEGKGDLHMPVGWGGIPYREVFSRLQGYEGIILLELKPRYGPYLEDALLGVRDLLEECGLA